MTPPTLLQALRTPLLMRRRQKARRQPLVFLRFPQCGGRSIVHALEAAGHTLAIPLAKQNSGGGVSSASQSAEEVEPDGLDFSQLGDRDDADLQQLILPKGSTLACLSRSFPAPGQLARCCPGVRTFTVLGDPISRLVVAYRTAVLQGDPTAADCSSLADFIEQNSCGVAAGDRVVRTLFDPRPIAASSDLSVDSRSVELAFNRLTKELDGCFLLEQPLVDLHLGQWLQLPGGRLSPLERSSFPAFMSAVNHSDRSAEELQELFGSIRVSDSCLALARMRNQYDIELHQRLASHFGS